MAKIWQMRLWLAVAQADCTFTGVSRLGATINGRLFRGEAAGAIGRAQALVFSPS
jgi:undecaprenyl pyrophosphate phosphatase UppP